MEQPPFISQRRDEPEFSLREWAAKAKITRDPATSRRFSGSYIRSFREDARSFRSNITTITSTASSPGYPFGDEIDPATYSFTNAIKALQARSLNSWECFSLDGFTLNSKWNEAEKYICNPLSGEVPMECLSAKSLSGRSFRNFTNRIAISAPLVYSNHSQQTQTKPCSIAQVVQKLPIPEKQLDANALTRDVGTQSTPTNVGSKSPSPASTPPIVDRALKRCELEEDSPNSNSKITPVTEVIKREMKEERAKEEKVHKEIIAEEKYKQGGCLSWMKKKQKEEQRSRRKRFLSHLKLKGC
ncbi:uncharacterized protein LOC101205687 [Cucumis sativus]|uniref:Uncharacterized protein n=1 Tax=Cucumis sativus TaxID=3659 RepID=A0A0A0L6V9_CUCSA|nr:uncharacterized protein LOC101205687 [Cucumis sativus]KGN57720.1 hypothetical protein Csa_010387 [Cucumis sativus]